MTTLLSEIKVFRQRLFSLDGTDTLFNSLALDIFRWQAAQNVVYRQFLQGMGCALHKIRHYQEIPCLPIQFFKSHTIKSGQWDEEYWFESSGTTGSSTSRHYVPDQDFYHQHSQKIFESHYGSLNNWIVLGLLPSYLEREHASLVNMAAYFIKKSDHVLSGFYLDNHIQLHDVLAKAAESGRKVLLLGVSFALLDLCERGKLPIQDKQIVVMETGGMKGRRKEMIRAELHAQLCEGLGVSQVHSEYGMTELFSQAYALGQGAFRLPYSMRIVLRDVNDPRSLAMPGRSGGINLIDLANVHSCCFIETQDLGRWHTVQEFEVLGRFDQSDVRGCNLLVM